MSGIRLWNSRRYKTNSYRADQQFGSTQSTVEVPASISPVNYPENVQSARTRRSSKHKADGRSDVQPFESLATTIAKDEWKRRTQQQLRQLQLAEDEIFSESSRDDVLAEIGEKEPKSSSEPVDSNVRMDLPRVPVNKTSPQAEKLLSKESRDPANRDCSGDEALENGKGDSSSQDPSCFQLPELGLPLPALQLITQTSDVDIQDEAVQAESNLGQQFCQTPQQDRPLISGADSSTRAVLPASSAFIHKRATSYPDRIEPVDMPTGSDFRASNPLPASFDRKTRIRRRSSGMRRRSLAIRPEYQAEARQLEAIRCNAKTEQQDIEVCQKAELLVNAKLSEKQELPENQELRGGSEQSEGPEQLEKPEQLGKSEQLGKAEENEKSELPERSEMPEKSELPEKPERREEVFNPTEGEQPANSRSYIPSAPPLKVSPDESLFSDLTSMATFLRNRTTSFAFPVDSEKGTGARSRSSSVVQEVPSAPYTPKSTRSNPAFNNESSPYGGKIGSSASLHVIRGSPQLTISHDTPRASPDPLKLPGSASLLDLERERLQAPKYHIWKGHRYELSSDNIPSAHGDLAELSAEPASPPGHC